MQTADDEERFLFVDLNLVLTTRVGERRVEPFVERLDGAKDLGKYKVEEGPQLGEVVLRMAASVCAENTNAPTHLERCSGENKTVARGVVRRESNRQFTLRVLHAMSLVDDHVHPLDFGEERSVLDDVFVRREEDLEVALSNLPLRLLPLRWRTFVRDHLDRGRPLFKLHDPVGHRREGDDDEEGAVLLLRFDEERDEGDGLDRFPESLQSMR